MTWQQLHLICTKEHAENAESLLLDAGAVSILLEDAGDEPLFEPLPGELPLWSTVIITAFFAAGADDAPDFETLAQTIASQTGAQRYWLSILDDKDWSKEWLKHYQPIECNRHLWIVPQWLDAPNPSAVNIFIDPGLAFGTGYHATTRLCLDWLSAQNLTGKTVLDYGCGSGILGIAALLLGAKNVLAVDIDPQALLATQQNATRNGVANRLQLFLPADFDAYTANHDPAIGLLTANILAAPLIALAPKFYRLLQKNATFVLSGLLKSQASDVLAAYTDNFAMDDPFSFDMPDDCHWCRLSGKHKPDYRLSA